MCCYGFDTTRKSAIGESLCRASVICRILTRLFFVIIAVFLFSSFVSCSADGEPFVESHDKTADLNIAVSAAGTSVSAAGASVSSFAASDNASGASAGASVNSFAASGNAFEASASVSGASVSASGMSALKEVSSDDSVPEEFSSKGLIVEINDTILTSGTDSLYWGYTLVKTDSFGKTGEKKTITPLNGGNPGLANLKNLSVGKWKIVLSAYKTSALNTSGIVYRSRETEFSIKASGGNSIRIPVSKVQEPDAKGTLRILPRELTIAEEPYTAFSVQENGQAMADENIIRTPFGKLSEYSYRIYLYTDKTYSEGEQILADTTADVAQITDTVIEKSLTPGRYFFKIEIFRVKDTGDSHAETYLAFFPVEVYSNTVSTVKNREEDGVHAGLDVKEVREFKITYYDQGSSDNIPFSGVHPPVVNSELGVNYIKVHQYGRTEELDEPEKEGYGFAGWYTSYNGGVRVTSVPAWQYSDVKLYAKWTVKRYKSITYIDNFPLKALERKSGMTSHSDTYTRSTVSETDYIAMPSDPVCTGYVFRGWEIDALHNGYSNTNGLPPAWKADIEAVCRAQWEPVHYKVVVRCHSSINPAADFENYAEISAQVARLSTSWSNYDSEYPIIDPKTSKYGFLGYKKGNANASDPSNYVYNEAEMFGVEGYYSNLTTINNDTVYFYALFSDYFTPLEYIRSYKTANAATNGQYIDTGLLSGLSSDKAARMVMTMEFAGSATGTQHIVGGGGNYTPSNTYQFMVGTDVSRDSYWRYWNSCGNGKAGLYFEDEKYEIDYQVSSQRASIKINGDVLVSLDGAPAFNDSSHVALFGYLQGGTCYDRANMRLYSCSIFNSAGEALRRFQPCVLKSDIPAAFSSTGVAITRTSNTEIGLWDLKTNKFYPNLGTGRFYQPSEEVCVTLKNHDNKTNAEIQADRTQKVLKGIPENLHLNLFSKTNSSFLGWGTTYNASSNSYNDGGGITVSSDIVLYARWSKPTSYNLFGQVEWIENPTYYSYINTGLITKDNEIFTYRIKGGLQSRADKVFNGTGWGALFGSYDNQRGNLSRTSGYFNPRVMSVPATAANSSVNLYFCVGANYNDAMTVGASGRRDYLISRKSPNEGLDDNPWNVEIYFNDAEKRFSMYDVNTGSYMYNNKDYLSSIVTNVPELIFAISMPSNSTKDANGHYVKWQAHDLNYKRIYFFSKSVNGVDIFSLVPAVLTEDLTSDNMVLCADGTTIQGNLKVFSKRNCPKGTVGMWDIVGDMFYCNDYYYNSTYTNFRYNTSECIIHYDGNGSLGIMSSQAIDNNTSSVRLKENRFNYPGHEFIGWNTMPDGTGVWYSYEKALHKGEYKNMTLFAQWRETPENPPYVQIEYIQNNGTGTTGLAYINTKVKAANNFRYYLKFVRLGASSCNIIGGYYPGHVHLNGSIYLAGANYGTIGSGTLYEVDGGRYNNLVDARYTANGGSWTAAATGVVNNNSMNATVLGSTWSLFARYPNISDGNGCKIYGFKLWDENEELIRDMIPVMLTEDIPASSGWDGAAHKNGELGLWDKCEGKFYSNANSSGYFSNADLQIVQYNANGGSGTMPNQAFFLTSEKVALNETAFTNGKKRFIGWNTAQDGSGVWYGDAYESADWEGGLLVLYAQWTDMGDTGSILTQYFEPVNYIRSVSFATIDTKIQAKNVDMAYSYRVKFSAFSCFVCGVAVDTASVDDVYFQNATTARIDYKKKQSSKTLSPALTTTKIHAISQSGRTLTIDGKSYTGDTASYSYPADAPNVVLFNKFTGNSNYQFSGCLYGAEVSNGTEKVKLIPCVLKKKISAYEAATLSADGSIHSEGEVGMWDLINNKFYGNANSSGVFTCEKN